MADTFSEHAAEENLLKAIQGTQTITTAWHIPLVRSPSILKWAGGKEQELRHILPLLPPFQHYYEPFVGGGAVFFSVQAEKKCINDKSSELIHLYRMVAENNSEFFQTLHTILRQWQRISQFVDIYAVDLATMYKAYARNKEAMPPLKESVATFVDTHQAEFGSMLAEPFAAYFEHFYWEIERNLTHKMTRMKQLESKKGLLVERDIVANMESALKSAYYMYFRHLYNKISAYGIPAGSATAIFFFVRENAYAAMFRYNNRGEFNVPYGGISYNRKDLARKIAYLQSTQVQQHLAAATIENLDFEAFLHKHAPGEHDFIFLDPPYDSEFSTYTQNAFSRQDQERLAYYLLHHCQAKFMLVIKNTPMIYKLYSKKGLHIQAFDKKYLVSFQDRNKRESEHLIITNFPMQTLAEQQIGRDFC